MSNGFTSSNTLSPGEELLPYCLFTPTDPIDLSPLLVTTVPISETSHWLNFIAVPFLGRAICLLLLDRLSGGLHRVTTQ